MQRPNDCFFCGKLCDRVICTGCEAATAADPLTGKEAALLAEAFGVLAQPVVITPGIDKRAARLKNPGMYVNCKCGGVKGKAASECRECRMASKYHPCPEKLTTGLPCGNRAAAGQSCWQCNRQKRRNGGARGGGRSGYKLAPRVAPERFAEARACALELMARLKARLGAEVRI